MVESFTLGGQVIRQIVLDPLLPPPLVPAGELSALVRAMRAYDGAGRASGAISRKNRMMPIEEHLADPSAPAWIQALSAEERRDLHQTRAWESWLSFAVNWAVVAAALAVVAKVPNPLTVVAALFVIGARQLGCAILMHEASHRSLFRSRALNDWAGNWLAAYPVWLDLQPYRAYHMRHHTKTWMADCRRSAAS